MNDPLMYFEPIFDVTFMMASALSVVRKIRIIDIREQVPCITQIGKIQFHSKALNNVFKRSTWCQTKTCIPLANKFDVTPDFYGTP